MPLLPSKPHRFGNREIDNVSAFVVKSHCESNVDCEYLQSIGCNFLIHKYQSTHLRENRKLALLISASDKLHLAMNRIPIGERLLDFGLSSLEAIELVLDLEGFVCFPRNPLLVWNYRTVRRLAAHLGA